MAYIKLFEDFLKESNNQSLISKAEQILAKAGLSKSDYIVSLQGPTIIFTKTGKEKLQQDLDLRVDLVHAGVKLMEAESLNDTSEII